MECEKSKWIVELEKIRWNGTPTCPYCGSQSASRIEKGFRLHCNGCYTSYSVTVGTLFHKTHVDLQKWFRATSLVLHSSKISARTLAKEIGVSKNTAAYMIQRIRNASNEDLLLLHSIVAKHQ